MNLKTNYGIIPIKELLIEKIPDTPKTKLPEDITLLYDQFFDKLSAPIWVKLKNKKTIQLNENTKTKIKETKWLRAGASIHKIKLPTHLDPKLAYLIGYLYGDGGFKDIRNSYKKHGRFEHKIIVGDEFEIQIERIKWLFKKLFNLETKIRKERIEKGERMYYINPTCKIIYRFFVKLFEFKEGPKKNIKIPLLIKKAPSEIKKWFLRGFVDADGDVRATEYYLNRDLPSPRIKVRLADEQFVKQLKKALNKHFSLNLTGPYSDTGYDWYIQCSKKGMINANKQTLFTHPIKRWRLENFLAREHSSA